MEQASQIARERNKIEKDQQLIWFRNNLQVLIKFCEEKPQTPIKNFIDFLKQQKIEKIDDLQVAPYFDFKAILKDVSGMNANHLADNHTITGFRDTTQSLMYRIKDLLKQKTYAYEHQGELKLNFQTVSELIRMIDSFDQARNALIFKGLIDPQQTEPRNNKVSTI